MVCPSVLFHFVDAFSSRAWSECMLSFTHIERHSFTFRESSWQASVSASAHQTEEVEEIRLFRSNIPLSDDAYLVGICCSCSSIVQ